MTLRATVIAWRAMNNPYEALVADAKPTEPGLATLGKVFSVKLPKKSWQQYSGKIYVSKHAIAGCADTDLSAQVWAHIFGLIGLLIYLMKRRKAKAQYVHDAPPEVAIRCWPTNWCRCMWW
jgi:hypothetical protein